MAKDIIKYIKNINRKPSVPRRLLEQFIAKGASTIPELSKGIGVSLPTTTNALNELMGQGLVREIGKKADSAGRIPMVYDLEPTAGYFVGVNPEMDSLALAVSDFCGNLITEKQKVPYVYENTPKSLAKMGKIINVFIDNLPIKREEILEVCVNVAERVRPLEGRAYNMFNFLEEPLAEKLTELLELPTCIENDSRSMTYGEFIKGCCKGKKDVIFVNVCWGLGIGIIIDGKLYYGKSGYSGEFGHMTAYNNNIICHCGKIGCVETEVSGRALKRKLTENILAGKPSILSDKVLKKKEELTLEDIMDAIAKEDVLSLATLQHIADELGKQLAGIINIFNPEMLVIGGEMSVTGDYLTLPVNMGIKKYSLNIMNEDSQIVTSELKDQAGVIGACLIARQKLLTI
ncbi:ROK family protein [Prevotella copri]|uniref:ROK family protein n=1 Tax=Segatella copri TaxID=165179 RepID=A0AAP3BF41_9BACT|nr:ROK family transcriptional regulator [Segatella copri]MCW4129823.1 ROK family protein [Segatella copri]MCW4414825.1 ROK family protein [Segatella copri]MCW4422486.1 ROK family protein [Segatella copri]